MKVLRQSSKKMLQTVVKTWAQKLMEKTTGKSQSHGTTFENFDERIDI